MTLGKPLSLSGPGFSSAKPFAGREVGAGGGGWTLGLLVAAEQGCGDGSLAVGENAGLGRVSVGLCFPCLLLRRTAVNASAKAGRGWVLLEP